MTPAYDPLRDEGDDYAGKLKAAGVAVSYANYPGMVHGFFDFQATVDVAREAIQIAGSALAKALR